MKTIIRQPMESELGALKEMWKISFDDPNEYVEWYFCNRYVAKNTFVLLLDNKPVASLQLFDKTLRIRGTELPCKFVVGACTLPEYRNKGLMRKLLVHVSEKFGLVALYPAVREFYRKLGYGTFAPTFKLSANTESAESTYKIGSIDDIVKMYSIYRRAVADYPTALLRNCEDMRVWCQGELLCGAEIAISDTGYVVYSIKDDKATILEAISISQEHGQELKRYFSQKCDVIQVQSCLNIDGARAEKGGMLRIDPILLNGISANGVGEIAIKIIDPMEICSGNYRICAVNGEYSVSRCENADITLTMDQFSAIAAGENETVVSEIWQRLSEVFPTVNTLCMDMY